jgi:hypothetical protein
MYPVKLHPRMELPAALGLLLFDAAAASVRAAARKEKRPDCGSRPGRTLRPGSETPIWNELARQTRPYLRKRGEKVKLARVLGVPRQRLNEYLHARTACPDAERALLLLCWLSCRQQGRELTA